VESFKLSLNKNILFWFLTLGTFGILWLISNWVVRIKILLRFEESNPLGKLIKFNYNRGNSLFDNKL
jgi:hypothetical protein